MEGFGLKHKSTLTAGSVVLFVITYILCGVFGWFDVIMDLFKINNNAGSLMVMPVAYSVISFIFLALLIALSVFGFIFKNKVMIFLALCYEVLFAVTFALLGVFATGGIENVTVYKVLIYSLSVSLAPIYGVIWYMGAFFFLILIPLLVFGIVSAVKVCKKPKTEKKK